MSLSRPTRHAPHGPAMTSFLEAAPISRGGAPDRSLSFAPACDVSTLSLPRRHAPYGAARTTYAVCVETTEASERDDASRTAELAAVARHAPLERVGSA